MENNDTFQNQVGDNKQHMPGCSPFFLNSSALSILTNKKNRKYAKDSAMADIKFQRELLHQKEFYEDLKEAEDTAFKLWLRNKQREDARIENAKRLENDLQKSELQMFFKDWPLQISIEAVNEKRKRVHNGILPINIIIGKHFMKDASDPLAQKYSNVVDGIKSSLNGFGIAETNVYRFKDDSTLFGGAALACIYSMMNTLPSVVILPRIDNRHKQLIISVGVWSQDSLFPIQKEVLRLNYDSIRIKLDKEYLDYKIAEIQASFITVASVLNDAYSILEGCHSLQFPLFANKYKNYPHLMEFAKNEYESLLNTNDKGVNIEIGQGDTINLPYSNSTKKEITKMLTKAIKQLSII